MPNVIMADVFNEPYAVDWATWKRFVQDVGAQILARCPRWLIVAEGVANSGDGNCCCGGCWWGENVAAQLVNPIVLPIENRLVLSPHVYGHGGHMYMSARNFPNNMPSVWAAHWGH
eukprot:7206879-Prymnesium_polylepis.1